MPREDAVTSALLVNILRALCTNAPLRGATGGAKARHHSCSSPRHAGPIDSSRFHSRPRRGGRDAGHALRGRRELRRGRGRGPGRVSRRCGRLLQGVHRGGRTRRALDHHPRVGLRQPHRTVLRRRRGVPGDARRFPEPPGAPPPQARDPRARLGLSDDLRARPRIPAPVRPRVEAASARPLPVRRQPSRRGLASPEDRRDRRALRARRRPRSHRAPLGHAAAPAERPASGRVRPAVPPVPRLDGRARRRGGARAGGDRAPALAHGDRRDPAAGPARRTRSLAPRPASGRDRRARCHRLHRAGGQRRSGDPPRRAVVPRHDRARPALHLHREPVLHLAHHRRGAGRAARRAGWPGDRAHHAPAQPRLARGGDHARAPRAPRQRAARGRPERTLSRVLPAHRGARRRHVHRCAFQADDRRRRVAAHRLVEPQQSLDGRRHRVRRRDRGAGQGAHRGHDPRVPRPDSRRASRGRRSRGRGGNRPLGIDPRRPPGARDPGAHAASAGRAAGVVRDRGAGGGARRPGAARFARAAGGAVRSGYARPASTAAVDDDRGGCVGRRGSHRGVALHPARGVGECRRT